MNGLRALAAAATGYAQGRLANRDREHQLDQELIANLFRERAARLDEARLRLAQDQAAADEQWRQGSVDRALAQARGLQQISDDASAASAASAEARSLRAAFETAAPGWTPPPTAEQAAKLSGKQQLLGTLTSGLQQPTPAAPQMGELVTAPGQQPVYVSPPEEAPVGWAPVETRRKTVAGIPTRTLPNATPAAAREATPAEMRAAIAGAEGTALTAGPQGTTWQVRRPTDNERAATEQTKAQTEALRQQMEDAAAFLPVKLKAADLQNQTAATVLALKNWDLTTLKPLELNTALESLSQLKAKGRQALKLYPLQLDELEQEIAKRAAEITAIRFGIINDRARTGIARTEAETASQRAETEAANGAAYRQSLASQQTARTEKADAGPTSIQRFGASSDLADTVLRTINAVDTEVTPPAMLSALRGRIEAMRQDGLLPTAEADGYVVSLDEALQRANAKAEEKAAAEERKRGGRRSSGGTKAGGG